MSRIITFLDDGSRERTTLAIATAKWFARQGKRVLLATYVNPSTELLLETSLSTHPQSVESHLQVVQLQTTVLLEQAWDEVKKLVSTYLPDSFSEQIYPAELIILPGFDSFLTFNALRQYYQSGSYDVIIYSDRENLEILRMLGIPSALDWYYRRFHQIFADIDISEIANSIGGPLAAAILNANIDRQKMQEGLAQIQHWIEQGVAVVNDASQLTAYLVTNDTPEAIADTRWWWGSAQQINLTVSGILAYQDRDLSREAIQSAFTPLAVHHISTLQERNWEAIIQELPDFNASISVTPPLNIDLVQRQVRVFLPGFNKKQVKLTQSGAEIVVEAGDQRRQIVLPPELKGKSIQSGKFEEPYLVISF
ncbi:anion-transporting ATPase [cyanobacterium TDX16]|nr:anion-transporting ATPase [cyanobacterium TDX16]